MSVFRFSAYVLLFTSGLALSVPAANAETVTYQIDPAHSAAEFSVRHLMISNVKGQFQKVAGTIAYDPQNPSATKIDATIDTTTVDTREEKRNGHLKSPDFFDVAKFPTMTFTSKKVWKADGKLKVLGGLNMHGVTHDVTLDVDGPTPEQKDPWGNMRVGASATTTIQRKDWGLTWNKTLDAGGTMISDDVKISIDIEAVNKGAQAPATK